MSTKVYHSKSPRTAACFLFLTAAALTYLFGHLQTVFGAQALIAIATGWALVAVYALDVLKNALVKNLQQRRQREATNMSNDQLLPRVAAPRKQTITPMKQVTLSNGHVVKVA